MQDDITWGVKHLVAEGIADPKRVGIMGGSYGGYATLAGVTFTPDTYAAAVAIVAPSNLITLLDSIPPYWEQIRTLFYKRMGDPNTEEGKKQLIRQSPLTHADKIKTPLMVVQGANDPRVNKRESDQIVIALRDRNYPVEYLVAPDEGHGFARPINNLAMIASAEKFLAKHLGGRYQVEMTDAVRTRLGEITVDPKDVKMPEMINTSKLPKPIPMMDLKPSKAEYTANIALGGQNIPLSVSNEIKEENGNWTIIDYVQTPQGDIKETSIVEKGSLKLKRLSFEQTGMTVLYEIQDNRAVGKMTMNDTDKAINKDLADNMFADGAGSFNIIATLPLEVDYTTSFSNFDVQTDKVKTMILKVLGIEKVTVPAGEFETFKVSLTSKEGDNTTAWIDKESRKVVKISSVLAQLGGAVLTSELAK
jgi:dienelactone hydrolase